MEKFLKSMQIGFIEWHDGIGYDLDALKELDAQELKQVESLLISRKDGDWRDVEALAALKTPRAIEALKDCLQSRNLDARLFAVRYLKEMGVVDRVEEIVVDTWPATKIGKGMTFALSLAKEYPTERVKRKLLWCALHGNDDIRIHCAAMALSAVRRDQPSLSSRMRPWPVVRNGSMASTMPSFRMRRSGGL